MSYLVLARKYRPQTFADVIGQEHVTRTLQNAIVRGRIHHAFLFCGGRGTGKTTTARILAKALSCVDAPTPTPCNQCAACVEITSGSSVDVQEIDAASQNKVEDIRELRESIRYAPVRGKKKLYILDEVHMLSTSAFNALLKTLEEPPPHALFVFATTDPHKLPATILSRVQRYDFKLVPTPRLVEHLADVLTREGIEFDRDALLLVAREGGGSVRDSLSLLDQVLASSEGKLTEQQTAAILGVADRGLVLGLGQAVVSRDPERALQLVADAYGRGFDLAQLGRVFLGHLRDLVVVRLVKDAGALLEATGAEAEELRRQSKEAGERAELLFERMMRIAEDVGRSALPRQVLEVGLCELCRVEPLQPIAELLGRLEALEGQLEPGSPSGGPGGGTPSPGPGPGGSARTVRAPVAAGPVVRDFTALVEKVIHKAPLLSAIAMGRALSWDDDRLVIGFDSEFQLDQVRSKLPLLKGLVLEELGQPVQIELRVAAAAPGPASPAAKGKAESFLEAEDRKQNEERERRRREALDHPARKLVTEVFGEDVSFQDPELE